MTVTTQYEYWEEVYLTTDPDQQVRIITGIAVKPKGVIMYELSCGPNHSWNYEEEISRNKTFNL